MACSGRSCGRAGWSGRAHSTGDGRTPVRRDVREPPRLNAVPNGGNVYEEQPTTDASDLKRDVAAALDWSEVPLRVRHLPEVDDPSLLDATPASATQAATSAPTAASTSNAVTSGASHGKKSLDLSRGSRGVPLTMTAPKTGVKYIDPMRGRRRCRRRSV